MAANTIDIAPTGTMILVVGKADQTKLRLRVDPDALRAASPVFRTLLGPNFAEGQLLNQKDSASSDQNHERNELTVNPVEIQLGEDDAEAMRIIAHFAHSKAGEYAFNMTADRMIATAVAADKYILTTVGQVLRPSIIDLANGERRTDELAKLLAASILFDCAFSFEFVSRRLLQTRKGSYVVALKPVLESVAHDALVWFIIYLLEQKRSQAREKLSTICLGERKTSGIVKYIEDIHVVDFERDLHSRDSGGPTNFYNYSLSEMQKRLQERLLAAFVQDRKSFTYNGIFGTDALSKFIATFNEILNVNGLCLDCMRGHREHKLTSCRFHPV